MQIHMECGNCMNASAMPVGSSPHALCPYCQKPMHVKTSLPESNVLVADARPEPKGLRFDMESILALSAFALIVAVAVLFYTRFHA